MFRPIWYLFQVIRPILISLFVLNEKIRNLNKRKEKNLLPSVKSFKRFGSSINLSKRLLKNFRVSRRLLPKVDVLTVVRTGTNGYRGREK